MTYRTNSIVSGIALAVGLAAAAPALAQEAAGADPQDSAATQPRTEPGSADIVVTAQKREERLADVPIAISAFTNERLTDSGATQLGDFLRSAPGVGIVDRGDGSNEIEIRGANSSFGAALVGYYLDELPFSLFSNVQLPDVRTYDLSRVEVLRGPQGTLYGNGALGGVVRILTNDPVLDEVQGGIDLAAGDTRDGKGEWATRGVLNVPIVDDAVGLRVVGTREHFGGWVDNLTTGTKDENKRDATTYRAKLRIKPADNIDVILGYWHSDQSVVDGALSDAKRETLIDISHRDTDFDIFSGVVRVDLGAVNVVSSTSWIDYKQHYVTDLFGPLIIDQDQHSFAQEVRLTSASDGIFRWSLGGIYNNVREDSLFVGFGLTVPGANKSISYAAYGEGTLALFDRKLDLTAGLRYFHDDRGDLTVDPATLAQIRLLDPDYPGTFSARFKSVSPRFNATYHITRDVMVYANVAKGFRTGQRQSEASLTSAALAGLVLPFGIEPETMWSYEAGSKASLADGQVLLEGAGFYNDWSNVQVNQSLNAGGLSEILNGGKARTYGAEFSATILPAKGLAIRLAASQLRAEYSEAVAGTPIVKGTRIGSVPETNLSGSATYRFPLNRSLNGFLYGSAQYLSSSTDIVSGALPSDGTTLADLRAGVEGRQWGAYLYVTNLTDEKGATGVFFSNNLGSASRLRPRTVGLNLRFNFGGN